MSGQTYIRAGSAVVLGLCLTALPVSASSVHAEQQTAEAKPTDISDGPKVDLSVPFNLNGRYLGDISVRVDMAGSGEIDAPRLLELLSPIVETATTEILKERIGGREMVSMTELSSGSLMMMFDPGLLEVSGTLAASALGVNTIGINARPPPEPDKFDTPEDFALGLGVTYNHGYNFSGENKNTFAPARANFEGYAQFGGFNGSALFYGFDINEAAEKTFRRREIQLIKDFYKPALRLSAGDINAPVTAFQGTPPLLGVSLAREYRSIQPFQNIVSSGRGSLELERDSKVEVYANGVLSETLYLPAGRYDLTDFPVSTGSNDVQLVVEDETGRIETTNFSFFSQSGLLGEGLIDFAASAGVARSPTKSGFSYGEKPIVTGFVDYGLLSWLTLGVNGQARDERQQVGASAAIGTPIGLFTADVVQSFGQDGLSGNAFGVDYRTNFDIGTTRFTTNASLIHRTRSFSTLNLGAIDNTKLVGQALLRAQFENGFSLGLSGNFRDEFDRPDQARANVNIGKSFDNFFVNMSADYIHVDGQKDEYELVAGVTFRLSDRHTSRVQYNTRDNAKLVELVRSRRRVLGDISGRAQAVMSDDAYQVLSELAYRHNRFDAELDFDIIDKRGPLAPPTSTEANWRLSSFIGFAGGQFGVGRRSDEGFILANRHKSLKDSGVAVLDQSGRQREAKVGLLGSALVPIERAYTPRQYSLDVDPLPTGYDIGAGQIDILPGLGMGYSYIIGSDASRTILGTIKTSEGDPLKLAVGTLEDVKGNKEKTRQFFTNSAGRMVAERISPGTYVVIIEGKTSKPIEIGEDTEGLVNVGTITLP